MLVRGGRAQPAIALGCDALDRAAAQRANPGKRRCRERITHDEVRAAAGSQGIADFSQVGAIVLETDGSLSVMRSSSANWSSLKGVTGWNE